LLKIYIYIYIIDIEAIYNNYILFVSTILCIELLYKCFYIINKIIKSNLIKIMFKINYLVFNKVFFFKWHYIRIEKIFLRNVYTSSNILILINRLEWTPTGVILFLLVNLLSYPRAIVWELARNKHYLLVVLVSLLSCCTPISLVSFLNS
jgi:hypothetical protein